MDPNFKKFYPKQLSNKDRIFKKWVPPTSNYNSKSRESFSSTMKNTSDINEQSMKFLNSVKPYAEYRSSRVRENFNMTTQPGGTGTTQPGGTRTTQPGGTRTTQPGGTRTTQPGGTQGGVNSCNASLLKCLEEYILNQAILHVKPASGVQNTIESLVGEFVNTTCDTTDGSEIIEIHTCPSGGTGTTQPGGTGTTQPGGTGTTQPGGTGTTQPGETIDECGFLCDPIGIYENGTLFDFDSIRSTTIELEDAQEKTISKEIFEYGLGAKETYDRITLQRLKNKVLGNNYNDDLRDLIDPDKMIRMEAEDNQGETIILSPFRKNQTGATVDIYISVPMDADNANRGPMDVDGQMGVGSPLIVGSPLMVGRVNSVVPESGNQPVDLSVLTETPLLSSGRVRYRASALIKKNEDNEITDKEKEVLNTVLDYIVWSRIKPADALFRIFANSVLEGFISRWPSMLPDRGADNARQVAINWDYSYMKDKKAIEMKKNSLVPKPASKKLGESLYGTNQDRKITSEEFNEANTTDGYYNSTKFTSTPLNLRYYCILQGKFSGYKPGKNWEWFWPPVKDDLQPLNNSDLQIPYGSPLADGSYKMFQFTPIATDIRKKLHEDEYLDRNLNHDLFDVTKQVISVACNKFLERVGTEHYNKYFNSNNGSVVDWTHQKLDILNFDILKGTGFGYKEYDYKTDYLKNDRKPFGVMVHAKEKIREEPLLMKYHRAQISSLVEDTLKEVKDQYRIMKNEYTENIDNLINTIKTMIDERETLQKQPGFIGYGNNIKFPLPLWSSNDAQGNMHVPERFAGMGPGDLLRDFKENLFNPTISLTKEKIETLVHSITNFMNELNDYEGALCSYISEYEASASLDFEMTKRAINAHVAYVKCGSDNPVTIDIDDPINGFMKSITRKFEGYTSLKSKAQDQIKKIVAPFEAALREDIYTVSKNTYCNIFSC